MDNLIYTWFQIEVNIEIVIKMALYSCLLYLLTVDEVRNKANLQQN